MHISFFSAFSVSSITCNGINVSHPQFGHPNIENGPPLISQHSKAISASTAFLYL